MTNRPTNPSTSREDKPKAETPETPDFSKFEVHDSYHTPVMDNANAGGGKEKTKLSRQKLIELDANLSERDKEILSAIREYRYLLSSQIRRLLFMDAATPSAALRAANRNLRKLKEKGLIDSLSRRIGGVRSGSSGLVWRITHAGERLLHLHDDVPYRVTSRFFEPSAYFLAHTLAVTETAVRLKELSRSGQIRTTALQLEPECWRSYSECGTTLALKPDLYAAVISGEYEDRYFIEVDLDTESVAKVLEKCVRYHKYYRSGLEQEETDMFPLTIWLVPNERALDRYEGWPHLYRKEMLRITVSGRRVSAMIYIMNEHSRPYSAPSKHYFNTIMEGYKSAGFDQAALLQAAYNTAERNKKNDRDS